MHTVVKRLLQSVSALALLLGLVLVPAGSASANGNGGWVDLTAGHNVGIYVDPGTDSAKNPANNGSTDIYANGSSAVSANCWDYGDGHPVAGFNDVWYHISGEVYGDNRYTHSYQGWVFAPFVDNQAAQSRLPQCGNNGIWYPINGSNNVGEYSCMAADYCPTNSSDILWLNTNSWVFAQCYSEGQPLQNGDIWLSVSYEWQNNGGYQRRHSVWVYAGNMGINQPPANLAYCPIGTWVY